MNISIDNIEEAVTEGVRQAVIECLPSPTGYDQTLLVGDGIREGFREAVGEWLDGQDLITAVRDGVGQAIAGALESDFRTSGQTFTQTIAQAIAGVVEES